MTTSIIKDLVKLDQMLARHQTGIDNIRVEAERLYPPGSACEFVRNYEQKNPKPGQILGAHINGSFVRIRVRLTRTGMIHKVPLDCITWVEGDPR